jgi:hypothetical protein
MMRKNFSVLALAFCGLWSASQAFANSSFCAAVTPNLVANCGFETGDFTGWTIGGNTANPSGNYYGVDAFDANSGNYGAYMSQDFFVGTAPVTLSQTLTTSPAAQYTVTFWLEQDTAPTPGYTHEFSATFGGTTMLTLTPTVVLPGTVGSFVEYQFTETASTASTALSFSFENDDNDWSFDDVSVTPFVTPEPATLIPVGLGLLVLAWSKRGSLNTSLRNFRS